MTDFQNALRLIVENEGENAGGGEAHDDAATAQPATLTNPYKGATDPGAAVESYMRHQAEKLATLQSTVTAEIRKIETVLNEIGRYKATTPGYGKSLQAVDPIKAGTPAKPLPPTEKQTRLNAALAALQARKKAGVTPGAAPAAGTATGGA